MANARRTDHRLLWRASLIWFASGVVLALGSSYLAEVSLALDIALLALVFAMWPLFLFVQGVRSAIGGHRSGWLISLSIPLILAGFFLTSGFIHKASVYVHFLARKGVYDRLVADGRAGRLKGAVDPRTGWLRGEKEGVRYYVARSKPLHIEFIWIETASEAEGVMFDAGVQDPSGRRPGFPDSLGGGYVHSHLIF